MTRFADSPTASAQVTIPAPAAELWPFVTDVQLPVATSEELQAVTGLDGGEISVGSTFKGQNQRGDLRWTTVCTVEVLDEPTAFAWVVGDPEDAVSRWGFDLVESDGATTVTQWVILGPGRSGLTWAIKQNPEGEEAIVAARLSQLRASMQATLDALAARFAG